MAIATLKTRPEFLRLRGGARTTTPSFVMEARLRLTKEVTAGQPPASSEPRFGFTVTKKLGNAVLRNRIRRRLKAAVLAALPAARAECDYVIVAREVAHDRPFSDLLADVKGALERIARQLDRPTDAPRRRNA